VANVDGPLGDRPLPKPPRDFTEKPPTRPKRLLLGKRGSASQLLSFPGWPEHEDDETARIMIAIGAEERWHLQLPQRWVVQYNFYLNDPNWGWIFVRICTYLPFSARVCLNQHHWLAKRMR